MSRRRPRIGALVLLLLVGVALLGWASIPAGGAPFVNEAAVGASLTVHAQEYDPQAVSTTPTASTHRRSAPRSRAGGRIEGVDARIALRLATKVGTRGGAAPVRLGQAGEDAVRGAYSIGDKVPVTIGSRTRIPDGLTTSTVSEVKNVGSLSYSSQLRDYVSYAQQTGRQVDLYVRGGSAPTRLSGPLQDAIRDPSVPINLRFIP